MPRIARFFAVAIPIILVAALAPTMAVADDLPEIVAAAPVENSDPPAVKLYGNDFGFFQGNRQVGQWCTVSNGPLLQELRVLSWGDNAVTVELGLEEFCAVSGATYTVFIYDTGGVVARFAFTYVVSPPAK